ncbi:MAG: class I mannose-6-phosphate isomerase [Verrucomicrobiales bacterium]|nr:class I mannose-6-phosphate isomerase [Verrucomicrobiales bacterium]
MKPIVFEPVYQERVWGGRMLEKMFGRPLPDPISPYGESWELVDREEAQSVVAGGRFDGWPLERLWKEKRVEVFGARAPDVERCPLFVKILDASEKLSLQVHPPAAIADELGGEPKSEMWVVLAAADDAELYMGLRQGVGREAFERAVATGEMEPIVHRVRVGSGDVFNIPSGRLHAIGEGLVILEVQQNSDTTYRVCDWGRMGLDGMPRELHVSEGLRSINFEDFEPEKIVPDNETLLQCPEFIVERIEFEPGKLGLVDHAETAAFFFVVTGSVRCDANAFKTGDSFLIPKSAVAGVPSGLVAGEDGVTLVRIRFGEPGRS